MELEEKLHQATSEEDVIRILGDAGVDVSLEQLRETKNSVDGELDEEELDDVSGGSAFPLVRLGLRVAWRVFRESIRHCPTKGGFSGSGGFSGGGGTGGGRF